jgi:hypothetical protein
MAAQHVRTGGVPPVRLQSVVGELPADFDPVRTEARAEGYRFLRSTRERLGVGRDAL